MIETFTEQQWTAVRAMRTEYEKIGTCTDPSNRLETEFVLSSFYKEIDQKQPIFLWFDGPLSCCLVGMMGQLGGQLWDQLGGAKRLHHAKGPAIESRDGFKVYAWHGTRVPAEWIEQGEQLDPVKILTHTNVEQRRAGAEIVGWKNVLAKLQPRVIDRDHDPQIGTLLEVDLPDAPNERFLQVCCGTGREFVLPVPREYNTAPEANAATYNVPPQLLRQIEVRT